jgi:hypothetical protein
VRNRPVKRLLHFVLLLAFVAGLQLSAAPMSVAAVDGQGMAAGGMAGCGGCDKQDMGMMAGECVAVCVAPLAVVDQAPPLLRPATWPPESSAVPLPAGLTIPPDSSPPRA